MRASEWIMNLGKGCWLFLSSFMLSGCVGSVSRPWPSEQQATAHGPSGKLDFGWKLSGDRGVAPLQVFSDASRTWLQWLPGQPLPVISATGAQGEQVLSYVRQGPYTIVEGHWRALSFQSATQQARARRLNGAAVATEPSLQIVASAQPAPVVSSVQQKIFTVSPADAHLRQALTRWASLSGWRFEAEHWAVDIDIPLSASASFSDDFVTSVQTLVASTELSDRPLQPCFYANHVLRIVPIAEPCDRTLGDGAST